MSERENRQLVEQAYATFKAGDIPTLLQSMSEDVTWQLPEIENVPFAGKRRGAVLSRVFSTLASVQDARSFEEREFIAQGDKVVVLGHYVWQVKANGRTIEGDFAHVFTVRGGQIAAFQEYMDSPRSPKRIVRDSARSMAQYATALRPLSLSRVLASGSARSRAIIPCEPPSASSGTRPCRSPAASRSALRPDILTREQALEQAKALAGRSGTLPIDCR